MMKLITNNHIKLNGHYMLDSKIVSADFQHCLKQCWVPKSFVPTFKIVANDVRF